MPHRDAIAKKNLECVNIRHVYSMKCNLICSSFHPQHNIIAPAMPMQPTASGPFYNRRTLWFDCRDCHSCFNWQLMAALVELYPITARLIYHAWKWSTIPPFWRLSSLPTNAAMVGRVSGLAREDYETYSRTNHDGERTWFFCRQLVLKLMTRFFSILQSVTALIAGSILVINQ